MCVCVCWCGCPIGGDSSAWIGACAYIYPSEASRVNFTVWELRVVRPEREATSRTDRPHHWEKTSNLFAQFVWPHQGFYSSLVC